MSENTDTLESTLNTFFSEFEVDGVIQMPVSSTEERAEQDAKSTAHAADELAAAIAQANDC